MASADMVVGSSSSSAAQAGTLAALYGVGSRLREYGASSLANVSAVERRGSAA